MSAPRASHGAADLARLRGIISAIENGAAPPAHKAEPAEVFGEVEPVGWANQAEPVEWGDQMEPRIGAALAGDLGAGAVASRTRLGRALGPVGERAGDRPAVMPSDPGFAEAPRDHAPRDLAPRDLAPGASGAAAQSRGVAPSWGAAQGEDWRRSDEGAFGPMPLGVLDVDAALGGGLRRGALHEAAAGPGDEGALSAFVLGLAARALAETRRPLLLVRQEMAEWEAGRLYGPGLEAFGLPAGALLLVRVRKPQDVLFVMEEGLRCAGLSVVLGEFLSPVPEVLTATRRLALAARGSRRLGLMVRHKADPAPCAALTRWRVSALPSPALDGLGGLGAPRFTARLIRNRFGATGAWPLSFRDGGFRLAPERADERDRAGPALSQPGSAPAAHGSHRAADVA